MASSSRQRWPTACCCSPAAAWIVRVCQIMHLQQVVEPAAGCSSLLAGNVEDAFIPSDRETGRPRGFGFVTLEASAAQAAAAALNETEFMVSPVQPPSPKYLCRTLLCRTACGTASPSPGEQPCGLVRSKLATQQSQLAAQRTLCHVRAHGLPAFGDASTTQYCMHAIAVDLRQLCCIVACSLRAAPSV